MCLRKARRIRLAHTPSENINAQIFSCSLSVSDSHSRTEEQIEAHTNRQTLHQKISGKRPEQETEVEHRAQPVIVGALKIEIFPDPKDGWKVLLETPHANKTFLFRGQA